MNGPTLTTTPRAAQIPAQTTLQSEMSVRTFELDMVVFQYARQRFSRSLAVRPALDQQAKLNRILAQIHQSDPQFTQAELVRTAIQYFTDAWDLEHALLDTPK